MAKALAPQDDHAAAPAVEVESTVVALVDFAGGGAAAGGVAAGGEVVVVVVATSVAAWVARAAEKGASVLAAADVEVVELGMGRKLPRCGFSCRDRCLNHRQHGCCAYRCYCCYRCYD